MKRFILIALLLATASAQTGPHRGLFIPSPVFFVNADYLFASNANPPTILLAYPSSPTIGHRLIVFCTLWAFAQTYTGSEMSISDTQVNTWTAIGTGHTPNQSDSGAGSMLWAFTAVANATGADSVTCTSSLGQANISIGVVEFTPALIETSSFNSVNIHIANLNNVVTTTFTDTFFDCATTASGDSTMAVSSPAGFVTVINTSPSISGFAAYKTGIAPGTTTVTNSHSSSGPMMHACVVAMH